MTARVVLLAWSSRLPPGLLSGEAWSTLTAADRVLVAAVDHPLAPSLAAGGVVAEVVADPSVPGVVAELLGATGTVVWVASPDGDPGLATALGVAHDRGAEGEREVDVVLGSWDLPGARLLDLVAVMDRLRSPGGCPWDAEQTHASLVEYLVEEAYETVEAIETGDDPALREELGDLLLQVVFHARIAQEHEQPWGIDDVADGIVAKLVSRHPHVFADDDARTPDEVEANWKRLKAAEKQRASSTDGIPDALPALVLAAKLLRRTADVGVPPVTGAVADAADRAWAAALASPPSPGAAAGAVGDLLLALAARAHGAGVDLESELRAALRRYRTAVRTAEGLPQPSPRPSPA